MKQYCPIIEENVEDCEGLDENNQPFYIRAIDALHCLHCYTTGMYSAKRAQFRIIKKIIRQGMTAQNKWDRESYKESRARRE